MKAICLKEPDEQKIEKYNTELRNLIKEMLQKSDEARGKVENYLKKPVVNSFITSVLTDNQELKVAEVFTIIGDAFLIELNKEVALKFYMKAKVIYDLISFSTNIKFQQDKEVIAKNYSFICEHIARMSTENDKIRYDYVDRSLKLINECFKVSESDAILSRIADLNFLLGYLSIGNDIEKARKHYKEAKKYYKKSHSKDEKYAKTYYNLSLTVDNPIHKLEYLEKSAQKYSEINIENEITMMVNCECGKYSKDTENQRKFYQKSIDISKKINKENEYTAWSYMAYGMSCESKKEKLCNFHKSLAVWESLNFEDDRKALLYALIGDTVEEIKDRRHYYKKSISLFEKYKSKKGVLVNTLYVYGLLCESKEKKVKVFIDAIKIAKEIEYVDVRLAHLHFQLFELLEKKEDKYQHSKEIENLIVKVKIPDNLLIKLYMRLGLDAGNEDETFGYLAKTAGILLKQEKAEKEIINCVLLLTYLFKKKEFKIHICEKLEEIYKKNKYNDKELASVYRLLAENDDDKVKKRNYYKMQMSIYDMINGEEESKASCWHDIGKLEKDLGNLADSEKSAKNAIMIYNKLGTQYANMVSNIKSEFNLK